MAWLYIAVFSVVVAVVLVQLFKYFVTAPELAAQEAGTKRKNSTSKKQSNTKTTKAQKSTDSSSKQQESSSSSAQESAPKEKKDKSNPAGAVSSPAQPKVEVPKENKPAKENKAQKPKESKSQKDKVANSDLKASSGNESTDGGKKKEKGKKADAEKKAKGGEKKKKELATETTDEEFARQWAADYNPSSSSNKNEVATATTAAPEAWRQVGSSDAQIDEYKKKLKVLEEELSTSRETNKTAHEKHQEALSRATRTLQATEQQHKETIARLQRELDMIKDGGMGVNDTLSSKNYSKAERTEKPRTALKGLIADEKEKGKEDKKKETEEKERQDKQREERDKQDKESNDKEREEREKQTAAFKQKAAELEAKYKQAAEQLKATEAVNNFLTATLAAESRGSASAAAPAASNNDQSAALNKKIEELTQQLSKKEREAEDKIKAITTQLKEREAEFKVAEETHSEANAQIEKLRGQLSALEASLAKGSGNEEAIKQLQQSLNEEKEKAETAQQQFELAEAAKVSYKGKLEDALRSSFDLQNKFEALKKTHESAEAASQQSNKGTKALEDQLAAANAANSELNLKHAQQLEAEQKKVKELEALLAAEKSNSSTSQASIEDAKSQVADAQKSAEEANKRTQEATLRADDATRRVDEAAKTIQELNNELANLKKKSEEADSSKVDLTAVEQKHKDELAILEAKLTEEKSARAEVVNRLEELSTRVKELEAQPQAGGAAGLKLNINSPNRIAPDAPTEQQ